MQRVEAASVDTAKTSANSAAIDAHRLTLRKRLDTLEPGLFHVLGSTLLLRRFTAKYFAQLDVEYESLCPDDYKSQTSAEMEELRACNARTPSWHLNHRLEYLIWGGLPPPILRQRALVHRARLLALVGPEGSATFGEAFPPPAADVQQLRTEGLGLLVEIQRLRHVQSEFERLRNRLLLVSVLPGFGFVLLALHWAPSFRGMPLAEVAAILGMMGGYLSVLLRIGSLRWALKYAANYQQVDRLFWNLLLNFCLSILEGSLGAIILYLAFSTSILTGSIFPNLPAALPPDVVVVPHAHPPTTLMGYHLTHRVLTQLMLWSVVAGFSERAVPDFLSSLSRDLVRSPSTKPDVAK
jgi:hypothetical protein